MEHYRPIRLADIIFIMDDEALVDIWAYMKRCGRMLRSADAYRSQAALSPISFAAKGIRASGLRIS